MSEDVPTFGRENLDANDREAWDHWNALYEAGWVKNPPPPPPPEPRPEST